MKLIARNEIQTVIVAVVVLFALAPITGMAEFPERLRLNTCPLLLDESGQSLMLKRIAQKDSSPEVKTYQSLVTLSKRRPALQELLPLSEAAELLADTEQMIFHQTISAFLEEVKKRKLTTFTDADVFASLERVLVLRVPRNTIPERVAALKSISTATDFTSRLSKLRYALGELSLGEHGDV